MYVCMYVCVCVCVYIYIYLYIYIYACELVAINYQLSSLEHVVVVAHGANGTVDHVRLLERIRLNHHRIRLVLGPQWPEHYTIYI